MCVDGTNPASLTFLRDIQALIPDHIPCVYVITKSDALVDFFDDLPLWMDTTTHCRTYELADPLHVTCNFPALSGHPHEDRLHSSADFLCEILMDSALYPAAEGLRPVSREKRERIERRKLYYRIAKLSIASAVIVGSSWYFFSNWNSSKSIEDGDSKISSSKLMPPSNSDASI